MELSGPNVMSRKANVPRVGRNGALQVGEDVVRGSDIGSPMLDCVMDPPTPDYQAERIAKMAQPPAWDCGGSSLSPSS